MLLLFPGYTESSTSPADSAFQLQFFVWPADSALVFKGTSLATTASISLVPVVIENPQKVGSLAQLLAVSSGSQANAVSFMFCLFRTLVLLLSSCRCLAMLVLLVHTVVLTEFAASLLLAALACSPDPMCVVCCCSWSSCRLRLHPARS